MPEINTIIREDGLCDLQISYSGVSKSVCQRIIDMMLSDGALNGIMTIQGQRIPDTDVEKVMCIKILREIAAYSLGLKEAKDFVEDAFGGRSVMLSINRQKLSSEYETILRRNFVTVALP